MARSTGEIQSDIAVTRRLIEEQLAALQSRVPRRWWTPYAVVGAAFAAGVLLARVPFLRLVTGTARAVQAGLTVAGTVAAVDRFLAERTTRAA
jgi:uncharacterized protein (DUF2062 family)